MLRTLWLVGLCSALLPGVVQAQSRTSASVRGTVIAADSTPVVGAEVELRNESTGIEKRALTNERGQYLILLLPPGGPYTLTVRSLGYAEDSREGLLLQVGDARTLDIVLRQEAIELPGIDVDVDRARIFDPDQVGPATRITEGTLESLPILSRDVMELAVLSPLVKTTESGGFSIAGQNDRYNAVLVDGLLSKDMFGLTSGGVPGGQAGAKLVPLDAVSQYEVLVAPFDVRLSGFTGGVLNAVTRTGTNTWWARFGGAHRNEALMGDLSLPTGPVDASAVDRSLVHAAVGGPLVEDEVHFFIAGEFERRTQPPDGFNLFRDDPALIRISEENVAAVGHLFADQFGVDIGDAGVYPLEQDLANVFARVDWSFGDGARLSVRNILAHAANDQAPNRSAFDPYELSSNGVRRNSTNNLTSIQFFSDFGSRLSNEASLTVQRTVDRSRPVSDLPQIEVGIVSSIDDAGYSRPIRFGGNFYAQRNDLEQTSLRLTNSLDIKLGNDALTVGVTGAWYDIRHEFLPGARGEYLFASLTDLMRDPNAPERFQRAVLSEGQSPAVGFNVFEWGVFAQRQISAGKGLTMHFGLRLDTPHVFGRPERNFDVEAAFGFDSSQIPSGNLLLSPRWGFNWQSGGTRNTQVRGGAGFFSGQIPYVWLSNAFHDSGLRSLTQTCVGRRFVEPRPIWPAPPFDPSASPSSCEPVLPGQTGFQEVRNVVVFDPDFRYPQDLKMSVVVDRELSDRISGSFGVLFNKALNQVGIQDLNLEAGSPAGEGLFALGGTQRRYYDQKNDDYDHVLLVTNEGEDWAASVTAELRGMISERLAFQLGYSLARSWDRMSLVFTDMLSNFGLNPAEADVNKPPLTTSNFDRPHKVVAVLTGAPIPGLPDTDISLLYTGQSGLPFSYVYRGDVNDDGYPGLGGSFDRNNDLIYIPERLSDAPLSIVTRSLLGSALETDPCLVGRRGETLRRNACRAPWENRLDLRLSQSVEAWGSELQVELDLINVLSLLDPSWGRIQRTRPVVSLLELCQVACENRGLLPASWGGAVLPDRSGSGNRVPSEPWTVASPESQWQMQLGARVTLGG